MLHVQAGQSGDIVGRSLLDIVEVFLIVLDGIGEVLLLLIGRRQVLDDTCTLSLVVEVVLLQGFLEHLNGFLVLLGTAQSFSVVYIVVVRELS